MNEIGDTEFDPLDLAGQDKLRAETAEEERRRLDREADDLRQVLATKAGRRFVWRLLGEAGVFKQTFDVNPMITAFNEGQRSRGLALLDAVWTHSPQSYPQMVAEQQALRDRYAQRNRNASR